MLFWSIVGVAVFLVAISLPPKEKVKVKNKW